MDVPGQEEPVRRWFMGKCTSPRRTTLFKSRHLQAELIRLFGLVAWRTDVPKRATASIVFAAEPEFLLGSLASALTAGTRVCGAILQTSCMNMPNMSNPSQNGQPLQSAILKTGATRNKLFGLTSTLIIRILAPMQAAKAVLSLVISRKD